MSITNSSPELETSSLEAFCKLILFNPMRFLSQTPAKVLFLGRNTRHGAIFFCQKCSSWHSAAVVPLNHLEAAWVLERWGLQLIRFCCLNCELFHHFPLPAWQSLQRSSFPSPSGGGNAECLAQHYSLTAFLLTKDAARVVLLKLYTVVKIPD